MTSVFLRTFLLLAVAPFVAVAQQLSPAPFSVPTPLPTDGLPVARADFLRWLATTPPLPDDRAQSAREHLYALIAQDVKDLVARTGGSVPAGPDSSLAALFTAASRLGVPAADLIGSALLAGSSTGQPRSLGPFTVALDAPYLLVTSEVLGWRVRIPYFFMLGNAARQQLANGLLTDILVTSTLTAPNSTPPGGASQSTVLVLAAQTNDVPAFAAFWLQQLQLAPTDTVPGPVPQAMRAYAGYDSTLHIRKELAVFAISGGALIAIYTGLDGTFQANRPHYIDLLNSLQVRQRAPVPPN